MKNAIAACGPAREAALAIIDAETMLADTVEHLGVARLDAAVEALESAQEKLREAQAALDRARKERGS